MQTWGMQVFLNYLKLPGSRFLLPKKLVAKIFSAAGCHLGSWGSDLWTELFNDSHEGKEDSLGNLRVMMKHPVFSGRFWDILRGEKHIDMQLQSIFFEHFGRTTGTVFEKLIQSFLGVCSGEASTLKQVLLFIGSLQHSTFPKWSDDSSEYEINKPTEIWATK